MKVRVYVTLKNGLLDPQGKAIESSLQRLGYSEVQNVTVGKLIELTIQDVDRNAAERRIREMCDKLLANPVIENTRYEFAD